MKNLYFLLILTVFSIGNIQSQCTYGVELYDTFGDGWNGSSLTIKVNGVSVLTGLTIASGSGPEYFSFDVNTGDVITAVYTAGSWPKENQYIVYDADNVQIFIDGGDGSAPAATATIGTANCSACPTPSLLGVTGLGDTQATLQWGSTATEWNIEWGNDGFTLGGGILINTTDHPYLLTGLSASTSYDFYVQAVCGPGLTSTWAGPFTFTTGACPADEVCTYNLNMTDAGNSWNGANITVLQDGVSLGTYTVSGGGANYATVNICEGSLIELVWSSGMYDNECMFDMTDPYGNIIYSFPQGGAPDAGTFFSFTSSCVPPACPSPLSLNAFNITDVSAQLSWTETGDAAMWNVEYGALGFTLGTGVSVSHITDIPCSLTGLIPGMTYSFYVQSDCDADGTSTWVGPFTFTMGNPPLDNPSACEMGYDIPDGDCEDFIIEVDGVGGSQLGTDSYVKEVRLIATHTFDQDLVFTLTSPNGVTVVLSQQHGGGGDNYGVIDGSCTQYTSFKMDALTAISLGTAPFNGEFIPDGDFADFNDGSDPNGMWNLQACDMMNTDLGTFEFIHIIFGTFGTEAEILSYSFPEQTGPAVIDPVERTIDIEVDWEADIANLVATFTLSTGATAEIGGINQTSGLTANDFSGTVTYTIIAEDGVTSHDWTVNVTLAEMPQGAICSWPLPLTLPVYDEAGTTEGFGDDYDNTMTCSSNFMTGDDIVYEFTIPVNGTLAGTMTASIGWIGMFVTNGCPDAGGSCVISKTSTGSTATFSGQPITPGTYFLILSNYAPPQSMDFEFDLVFTPDPGSVDVGILSPATEVQSCNFSDEELISMCVINNGGQTLPTGDTIFIGYNVEGGADVLDTLILEYDVITGDSVCHVFSEFYDFSAIGEYEVNVWMEYEGDMFATNNTVTSAYIHYIPVGEYSGDTVTTASFPYTLDLTESYSSYYWYNADHTLTSTASTFEIDAYGWYYMDLVDFNGCAFIDSVFVDVPVSINSNEIKQIISIYPNPNNGEFSVKYESPVQYDVEVRITDVCGSMISEKTYKQTTIINERYDISSIAPGVYFVSVRANDHNTVVKMIVQ